MKLGLIPVVNVLLHIVRPGISPYCERIASELFNGGLITPEPIYSFVKASNAKVVRKPRKTREPKTLKVNVDPELTNAPDETEPFPIDENLTPVPDALGKSDAK